jgi:hypothetical protein
MNKGIIEFNEFLNDYTILDSELLSIFVFTEDGILQVALILKLNTHELVRLVFKDVKEYNFYYTNGNDFYIVSDYILSYYNNLYYVSLDPYEGNSGPSNEDSDYIKSNNILIEFL